MNFGNLIDNTNDFISSSKNKLDELENRMPLFREAKDYVKNQYGHLKDESIDYVNKFREERALERKQLQSTHLANLTTGAHNSTMTDLNQLYSNIHGLPFRYNMNGERTDAVTNIGLDFADEIFAKSSLVMFAPGRPKTDVDGKDIAEGKTVSASDFDKSNNDSEHNATYNFQIAYKAYFDMVIIILEEILRQYPESSALEFREYITGNPNLGILKSLDLQKFLNGTLLKSYLPVELMISSQYNEIANILFMNNGGIDGDNSFSNNIGESAFKSIFSSIKDNAKVQEGTFMLNSKLGDKNDSIFSSIKNIFSAVGGDKITKLIIPDVWLGSSRGGGEVTYNFILSTPYGDPLSSLIKVMFPLSLLLPFVQVSEFNGISNPPFLMKTYTKGGTSIMMGMASSMSIHRSQEHSNVYGQPTRLEISLTVTEMYKDIKIPTVYKTLTIANKNYYFTNFLSSYTGYNITPDKGIFNKVEHKLNDIAHTVESIPSSIVQGVSHFFISKVENFFGRDD